MPVTPGSAAVISPCASTRAIEGLSDIQMTESRTALPGARCLSDFERSTGGVERHDYLSLGCAAGAAAKEKKGKQQPEKRRRNCRAPFEEMWQESASRRKWNPLDGAAC